MHAAVAGEPVEVVDALEDRRWPGYAEAAAARGSRSSLSVPLRLSGEPVGALNLYGEGVAAFADADVRRSAGHVGDTTAAGLTALLDLASAAARSGNLETAMDSRAVIEQAKGILMERRRVTADGAFELLRDASQHTQPEAARHRRAPGGHGGTAGPLRGPVAPDGSSMKVSVVLPGSLSGARRRTRLGGVVPCR